MASKRRHRPPALEFLEERLALAAGGVTPASALGLSGNEWSLGGGTGSVPTPHAVGQFSATVPAQVQTSGKPSTIIGLQAVPTPGSRLTPVIVSATGPNGQRLPFRSGYHAPAPIPGGARAYAKVAHPGQLTANVTGVRGTTGQFAGEGQLIGDINGDGRVTVQDLFAWAPTYLSSPNDGFYNPTADGNQNGFIGQGDAKLLLRNLSPVGPKRPLNIDVSLAPQDLVRHPGISNSGGVTRKSDVTVVGHTTPGSIVFADSGLGDYSFTGPAIPADANGNFSLKIHLNDQLTNTEYLVIDPWGQQTIRAYPIVRLT